MLNNRNSTGFWLIFIPDIVWLYVSLFLALWIRYGQNLTPEIQATHLKAFSLIFLFWLVVFFSHGLFDFSVLRRYTKLFFSLLSASVVNIIIAITIFYSQSNWLLRPGRFLILQVVLAFILLFVWHLFIKYVFKNRLTQGLYLFSFNNELRELEQEIVANSFLGFRVLGHLNSETLDSIKFNSSVGIILPDNLQANPDILKKFYELRTLGVNFYNHKDFYEQLLRRVYLSQINEIWFLENIEYREKRIYNLIKRLVDVLLGLVGVGLFLISLPLVALIIVLNSRGGIFFAQERVGQHGKRFKVYKYRTMKQGTATNTWTSVNDPRITKVGKFLRMSRIDELPQFINLILGNMSLVGPRPEQPHLVEDLKRTVPFYDERHLVKPGLTGWAQLNIYASTLEETKLKLQYDLYYIKHRSLLFDLEIIIKTIYYIFTWQGR
jgi:exopolysaccharide biosynthesis polyprenyl glycosylphosphotransferase